MKINFWRFRQLYRSIYNLFYYFKVIWKDRDWDHSYIELLLLKKYKKAYNYRTISKYYIPCVGDDKQNQALRICINILERRCCINNYYFDCGDSYSIEERDWLIYCNLIIKYHRSWWD